MWDWELYKGVAVFVVEVETLGQKEARKVFRRQEIGWDVCVTQGTSSEARCQLAHSTQGRFQFIIHGK